MSLLTDALDQILLALTEPDTDKAAVHASLAQTLTQLHVANTSVDTRRIRPARPTNGMQVGQAGPLAGAIVGGAPGTFDQVFARWKTELDVFAEREDELGNLAEEPEEEPEPEEIPDDETPDQRRKRLHRKQLRALGSS